MDVLRPEPDMWLDPEHKIIVAQTSKRMFELLNIHKFDVVFLAGWSWIVPDVICKKYTVVGMHPSDLPDYAGGSPIQHQVLDGLTRTKATLFMIPPGVPLDRGPILLKEEFSLEGGMNDIFAELTRVTRSLLQRFVTQWPDIVPIEQPVDVPQALKRLKPIDSKLTKEKLQSSTALELYNTMRCREDPYPNTYIEDETGTLYFSSVKFVPKP